jgi:hypothetical protein
MRNGGSVSSNPATELLRSIPDTSFHGLLKAFTREFHHVNEVPTLSRRSLDHGHGVLQQHQRNDAERRRFDQGYGDHGHRDRGLNGPGLSGPGFGRQRLGGQ